MATSDTGSSFAQWAGLYDPDVALAADGNNNVIAPAASPTSAGSGGGSPAKASQHPGIEGPRVGKPARRRSRASRRAPVTLLNTDTANFRAMVQQFTGIPAPPAGAFGAGPAGGVPVISFAGDYGFPPSAGVMPFDHLYRSQQHHHPPAAALHEPLLRRQQQQYTGGAFGYNGLLQGAGAGGDVFASAEDRMLLQSIQAAQIMPPASAANATSLGFFA
jgi:hypothetical protein